MILVCVMLICSGIFGFFFLRVFIRLFILWVSVVCFVVGGI